MTKNNSKPYILIYYLFWDALSSVLPRPYLRTRDIVNHLGELLQIASLVFCFPSHNHLASRKAQVKQEGTSG
jgi:hypothetical protein